MTTREKWCIDFDDTIADLSGALLQSVYERSGVRHRRSEIATWDWWKDHDDAAHLWGTEVFMSREWNLNIPAKIGAHRFLRTLRGRGIDYIICSNRPNEHKEWIEAWFAKNFLGPVTVTVTNFETTKIEIANAYECNIAIDDSPHQIYEYIQGGLDLDHLFVIDYPYNANIALPTNATRVSGVYEVVGIIRKGGYIDQADHDQGASRLGKVNMGYRAGASK